MSNNNTENNFTHSRFCPRLHSSLNSSEKMFLRSNNEEFFHCASYGRCGCLWKLNFIIYEWMRSNLSRSGCDNWATLSTFRWDFSLFTLRLFKFSFYCRSLLCMAKIEPFHMRDEFTRKDYSRLLIVVQHWNSMANYFLLSEIITQWWAFKLNWWIKMRRNRHSEWIWWETMGKHTLWKL